MYTHLLLISTVQIPRAYCSFFYYNIFIVSEQVFLRFFMNLSRHARICNSSHHLQKATEKVLFAYKLTQNKVHQSILRHCIQYEKTVFQRRPYRGKGILATVVKNETEGALWLSVPIMFRSILPCISSVFTSISIPKSIAILVNNAFKTVQQSAKDAVIKTIPSSPSHPHASDK